MRDHRHRADHRLRARRRRRASRSARSPRSSPTSGSGRARGRRGRWRAGACAGSAARRSPRSPGAGSVALGARGRLRSRRLRLRRAPRLLGDGRATAASSRSIATWRSRRAGVPFNVAHAVGNFVLALAAGPAMVRMIVRYRERFEFRRARRPGAVRRPVLAARPWRSRSSAGAAPRPAAPRRAAGWLERGPEPRRRLRRLARRRRRALR